MSAIWEIDPHMGVGPVRFGMDRHQVRAVIDSPSKEFQRTSASIPADRFIDPDIFAFYDAQGSLMALEFADQDVRIGKLKLGVTPAKRLCREILSLDPEAEIEAGGFTSYRLGVGIWTESDLADPPQSVIVFARGYYD